MLLLRSAARRATTAMSNTPKAMYSRPASGAPKKPLAVPRPSASIMLLSPTNQLLLLHRVGTSTSFASAHVFPGGNLSSFHEAELVPAEDSPARHADGLGYRLAAIRETFEESGILLARGGRAVRREMGEKGRKDVHADSMRFTDWMKSVGLEPDVDGLIPFTRWITPPSVPKRFTTQMYVYMLPLNSSVGTRFHASHDGGVEHSAAEFADVRSWLARQARGEIILYPPQLYLLQLLGQFLTGEEGSNYAAQRAALGDFLAEPPEAAGAVHDPTARISWADKVISPVPMPITRADGRTTLALDGPGPELKGSGRGGDYDRVVVVDFRKGSSNAEVRWRKDVEAEAKAEKAGRGAEEGKAKL